MRRGSDQEPRRFWSAAEIQRLKEMYPNIRTDEIARRMNRTTTAIYGMATKLELSKSEAFLKSPASGQLRKGETVPGSEKTQFKKGQAPMNKGLRRPGWHSGRMKETQFKKGEINGIAAQKWKPIGTIMPDSEGYLRIKIRERIDPKKEAGWNSQVWKLLSHHVWEQHHGPVPPKHMVAFKDRDRSNCAIGNLEVISISENARRNSMWNLLPRELAEAIQLNAVIKRKLRSISGKEQNN